MEHQHRVLDRNGLRDFIEVLNRDRDLWGPVVLDGTIRYGRIRSIDDLPQGWTDSQAPGEYRASHALGNDELFGFAVGPDSLKQFFHPPTETVFRAERTNGKVTFTASAVAPRPLAFIGVRPCELAAVSVQDVVLHDGRYVDDEYVERRRNPLLVAVDCGRPAATCFCTSMHTGPSATDGFDIAITESPTADGVKYVCRSGTTEGVELLEEIDAPPAEPAVVAAAEQIVALAADSMPVRLDPDQARRVLAENSEAELWSAIESRCLACANCTMVCPTCFCTTVVDSTDLTNETWTRTKTWDSCFSLDFSALHQHPIRETIGARYRQWLTHKLSTWHDQFGSSGCVGCGRCITWCPVGIDLVAELDRLSTEVPS